MISLHQSPVDQSALTLPTSLLKRILTRRGIHFGGRVLVAGGSDGNLVSQLDRLGYEVEVIDDQSARAKGIHHTLAESRVQFVPLDRTAPSFVEPFDSILVQDLAVYQNNWVAPAACRATSNLLNCLKDEGELVFIGQQTVQARSTTTHTASCLEQHLQGFPGQIDFTITPEPFFHRAAWDWLTGARSHHRYFAVTLTRTVADQRLSSQKLANHSPANTASTCCPLATVPTAQRHAA